MASAPLRASASRDCARTGEGPPRLEVAASDLVSAEVAPLLPHLRLWGAQLKLVYHGPPRVARHGAELSRLGKAFEPIPRQVLSLCDGDTAYLAVSAQDQRNGSYVVTVVLHPALEFPPRPLPENALLAPPSTETVVRAA